MKSAIVILEMHLETMEINEPINRRGGNEDQADLEAKTAAEIRQALEILRAAELCQWCPHEMRGEVLRAWDAAAEPIRQMKRDLSPQNDKLRDAAQ